MNIISIFRYRDFIKELPVHLSMYILGYLDEATLFNCGRVSSTWHILVEEMRAEFYANQQMWEDIMLMQVGNVIYLEIDTQTLVIYDLIGSQTCDQYSCTR